jgi:hypothetical protein
MKITLRVGDTVQWYNNTPIHKITKIKGNKVYYHDVSTGIAGFDSVETVIRGINGLRPMFKYTPVKVQKEKKVENKIVKLADIPSVLRKSNGKIFTVAFYKRSDGSVRVMNARLKVQKNLTGKGMSYNAKSYKLMTVFDMQKNDYRTVDLTTVIWAKVGGKMYTVDMLDLPVTVLR